MNKRHLLSDFQDAITPQNIA